MRIMATIAGAADAERFWQRMAIGLAVFIVFGFAQFTARGFVDPLRAPFWVHLHGAAMLGWLALLIVQPTLVSRRNLVLHRRLGWVRSEEHTSELQSLMRHSSAVFCL